MRKTPFCLLLLALLTPAVSHAAPESALPAATRLLKHFDDEPSWSPDGSRLAFISNRFGKPHVCLMRADGTDVRQLTNSRDPDDTPSWSPDGRRIAFVSEVADKTTVFTIGADGTGLVRISNGSTNDIHPTWSPDSRRLIFNSDRDAAPGATDLDLYTAAADGTDVQRLTLGGANTYASWSADGQRILFRRVVARDKAQIAIMDVATRWVTAVTPGDARDGWPSWSPDGTSIVFASDRSGSVQIYTMRANGSEVRRLTNGTRCTVPRWSPDGRKIVFADARNGEVDLYQIDVP